MTSKYVQNKFRSWVSSLAGVTTNDGCASGACWILDLPPEIIQIITDYLNPHDLSAFSRACRTFYDLINQDSFWTHRIHRQFPHPVAQLYTSDLYRLPEMIQMTYEGRTPEFRHTRPESQLDRFAIISATRYNDEAIEQSHTKMYVSKDKFLTNLRYFQFRTPKNLSTIPFMKLIYFYLIDRKRRAAVNMDVVHLNGSYLVNRSDRNSLTGHVIQLQSVCWLEINGHFEQKIMPGKYEVSWRMKSQANNINLYGETEFLVVPSHGKMLIKRVFDIDFQNYAIEHNNQWFTVNMGAIVIYEPSEVYMAIRNWNNGYWKSGISWDCIELKIIP